MPGIRLDRALTTRVFHPLSRAFGFTGRFRLPILMYHSISDDPQNGLSPYYRTTTSPAVFRQHLRFLADEGYKALTLKDALSLLAGISKSQVSTLNFQPSTFNRFVVLTFDDGFRDFYTTAFPILKKNGFSATMFVPTAFIGKEARRF